jgi:hypothetical protein
LAWAFPPETKRREAIKHHFPPPFLEHPMTDDNIETQKSPIAFDEVLHKETPAVAVPDRSDSDAAAGKAAENQAARADNADRAETLKDQADTDNLDDVPSRARLRAYEDHLFGKDAVRINGNVERGYGSKFKEMTAPQARHYAALEKAIIAEQKLADAHSALIGAEASHRAALEEADETENHIDDAPDK